MHGLVGCVCCLLALSQAWWLVLLTLEPVGCQISSMVSAPKPSGSTGNNAAGRPMRPHLITEIVLR